MSNARSDSVVLHDFVQRYREDIIERSAQKLSTRPLNARVTGSLQSGVPLFLTQLAETLRADAGGTPVAGNTIGDSAARHGAELLSHGFSVSEVVHAYGDICQAVTELAVEKDAPISTEDFHTLNRCLDTAIAEAVTEHARLTAEWRSTGEVERLGEMAHEIRNHINSAMLAFNSLREGVVAVNGSTGAVLGRSLLGVRDVIDSTLADIRMQALPQYRQTLRLAPFLGDLAVAAALHAEYRGLTFGLEEIESTITIKADPHLLASAVSNLLSNALKFTRDGGHVALSATVEESAVRISVEDQCGGLPDGGMDPFQAFGERRGPDRSGLGLGLSIARKAVRSHGGDIMIRNRPGIGCIFTIHLPVSQGDVTC